MSAFVPAAVPATGGRRHAAAGAFVTRRSLRVAPQPAAAALRRAAATPVATAAAEPTKNTTLSGRGGKTDSDNVTDDPAPLNAEAPATESKFYQKYNTFRGKDVPTVSETMTKFNELFPRPVPSVYRNIISEILMTTHLAKHCAMWKYVGDLVVVGHARRACLGVSLGGGDAQVASCFPSAARLPGVLPGQFAERA